METKTFKTMFTNTLDAIQKFYPTEETIIEVVRSEKSNMLYQSAVKYFSHRVTASDEELVQYMELVELNYDTATEEEADIHDAIYVALRSRNEFIQAEALGDTKGRRACEVTRAGLSEEARAGVRGAIEGAAPRLLEGAL